MMRKIMIIIVFFIFILVGCTYVADPIDLSIELNPGIDTVEVNSSYTDPGATAYLDGEIYEEMIVIENNVDITKVGTYTIVYQTSFRRNDRHITRYVHVIDETPPEITLNQGVDTVLLNSEWTDAGIEVIDNSNLEVRLTVTGNVITSQMGEYLITYIVRDYYGNVSYLTRYVHVIE
jgi:hypothetical protein